ncbi:MAG: hypothetical protein GY903_27800 [Fuerstiella sp.]|nr:hypothetical protein [Fuerstiella sp.]MCP4858300.1 hypothetical protein [Fuerstiella sp.]
MSRRILLRLTLAVLVNGSVAMAVDDVTTLRWSELKAQGQLEVGQVVSVAESSRTDGREELCVVHDAPQPLTVRLATLESPRISKPCYLVRGEIRYEGVQQPGYLEMWSHFAGGGRYFSRTLSSSGPMGTIHGTSGWREFILPFRAGSDSGPPSRLEINLVLPAQGKVWIGPLYVSEFTEQEWSSATAAEGAWWGNRTGALIGGILGPLSGIMGAVVGILCGLGRGKTVCLSICWTAVVFGVVCLVAGIAALFQSQPYVVYYPLLLVGFIATVVMGGVLPTVRKRFSDAELGRMEAMDIGVT